VFLKSEWRQDNDYMDLSNQYNSLGQDVIAQQIKYRKMAGAVVASSLVL